MLQDLKMFYGSVALICLFSFWCSALQLRETRESEKMTPVDIINDIQGFCIQNKGDRTVQDIIRDTKAVIKNVDMYKEVLKLNKQLQKDIEWIIQETKTNKKERSRIFDSLKQEAKGICTIHGPNKPKDCSDLKRLGHHKNGVYKIYPYKSQSVKALCDMTTDHRGWTVIQRRIDGSTNFQRNWDEYAKGFGDLNGNFWFGNDLLHLLTSKNKYELRVDLVNTSHQKKYAIYKTFIVGGKASKYMLTVSGYSGDAGDRLSYHNGQKFSTKDQDNDKHGANCAGKYGPWWHKSCYYSALNQNYGKKLNWAGNNYLQSVMMIRKIY